ncbi:hypothetical protein GGX14DRAFT_393580 [Mycena pura]|uniref:Uncharacterized protein n=1 Tax=Mycena pura TaxID=153505 RepID=A0AAD6VPE7_9AGAR|nr:hypothetical protein GGX14DRAFT_393580 [Mycena pura]
MPATQLCMPLLTRGKGHVQLPEERNTEKYLYMEGNVEDARPRATLGSGKFGTTAIFRTASKCTLQKSTDFGFFGLLALDKELELGLLNMEIDEHASSYSKVSALDAEVVQLACAKVGVTQSAQDGESTQIYLHDPPWTVQSHRVSEDQLKDIEGQSHLLPVPLLAQYWIVRGFPSRHLGSGQKKTVLRNHGLGLLKVCQKSPRKVKLATQLLLLYNVVIWDPVTGASDGPDRAALAATSKTLSNCPHFIL